MMGNEYGCIDEYPNEDVGGMPIKWAKAKNQGDLEDDGRRLEEHRAMQRRCRQLKMGGAEVENDNNFSRLSGLPSWVAFWLHQKLPVERFLLRTALMAFYYAFKGF